MMLNVIGAFIRWLYGSAWRTVANQPKYKFIEYLNGPENSDDWFDITGHKFMNRIIGFLTLAFIFWLIFQLR